MFAQLLESRDLCLLLNWWSFQPLYIWICFNTFLFLLSSWSPDDISIWSHYLPTGLRFYHFFFRTSSLSIQFGWCLLFCLLVCWVFPLSSPFSCWASQLNFLFQLLNFLVLNFPLKYILFLSWDFLCWDFRFISMFSFVSIIFVIAYWNMFIMVAFNILVRQF